jgi:hypothetical protein
MSGKQEGKPLLFKALKIMRSGDKVEPDSFVKNDVSGWGLALRYSQ